MGEATTPTKDGAPKIHSSETTYPPKRMPAYQISSQGQGESFPENLCIGGAWWYFRAASLHLKEDSVQPSMFAIFFVFVFSMFSLSHVVVPHHQKKTCQNGLFIMSFLPHCPKNVPSNP